MAEKEPFLKYEDIFNNVLEEYLNIFYQKNNGYLYKDSDGNLSILLSTNHSKEINVRFGDIICYIRDLENYILGKGEHIDNNEKTNIVKYSIKSYLEEIIKKERESKKFKTDFPD